MQLRSKLARWVSAVVFGGSRLRAALLLVVVSTGATFLYVIDPEETRLIPACPFLSLTGLLCPGCGSARALHALLHGELAAAVLKGNAFRPTHLLCHCPLPIQFIDVVLPVHARLQRGERASMPRRRAGICMRAG